MPLDCQRRRIPKKGCADFLITQTKFTRKNRPTSFRINPKPAPNKKQRLKADFLFLNIRELIPSSFIPNLRYTEQKHPGSSGIQTLGYKKILLYLFLLYIKPQAIQKQEYKTGPQTKGRGQRPTSFFLIWDRPHSAGTGSSIVKSEL